MIDIVATEKDQDKRLETAKELQTYLVDACRRFRYTLQIWLLHTTRTFRVSTSTAAVTTTGVMHTSQSKEKQRHNG